MTAAELGRELGVSERTIYRDIASLTAEGAPISGEAGLGYVLGAGYFLPPLMLDIEEAEAVLLGLHYVIQRGDEVLRAGALNAQSKIFAVMPPAIAGVLDEPLAMPGPVSEHAHGPVGVDVMRHAIRSQRKLDIEYLGPSGDRTQRTIWPISVGFMEHARVVGAWCELRRDFRTFRLDRILSATEGERYQERRAVLLKRLQAAMLGY